MATITLQISDELANRMVMDFASLADLNASRWNDEAGMKGRRIAEAYIEARTQLIDHGFYGE